MQRTIWAAMVVLLSAAAVTLADDKPLNEAPDGFVNLFNGRDLNSWRGRKQDYSPYAEAALSKEELAKSRSDWAADAKKHWKVDGAKGEIVSDGKGVFLATDRDYGDFELYVDWLMVSHNGDSGIYLRGYPQIQIWDPENTKEVKNGVEKGSGALWNNNPDNPGKWPLVKADKAIGEWNNFHVKMIGSRVWVWFNDKLTVDGQILDNYFDRKKSVLPRGPIELQTHGSEIRFKNVFLREIGADEANATLAKRLDKGFKSIFNGKDFTGWTGKTSEYEVRDGMIVCKAGKGGNVWTTEEYGDFEATVEFKLPPAGNNGLAIRYPGNDVDTAYHGMCEIQVLDDSAPVYEHLDTRQYCGSIYGAVAAQRGYVRAPGVWNFEHVIVKGHTIKVELNGTVITDADVSKVTEFMANSKHPGITREKGAFGFAGHSDPVAFRNIRIKPLE
ncbi:MAG TPA: DUF1080 domain-containing protein [Tepidisphaeraceae bacterium]|jgi:hypothetical protein